MSINEANWTFILISLCFQINLLFALGFLQIPCWNYLELFPFLVHRGFCIRNFHRLWHRDELVLQIFMSHRSKPFACTYTVLELFSGCNFRFRNHFRDAIGWSFARQAGAMGLSKFSPRVFFFFLKFLLCTIRVIWIDKVNSSQSASIVELRFPFCPFLFFSILSGFTNFRPNFQPYMIWSGSRLNLCQSLPGPEKFSWRFLFQQSKLCESFPRSLTKVCSNRHSSNRQSSFLA